MTSENLENLIKTGSLKSEPADRKEINGLVYSAKMRLQDAHNPALSIESRFDLAYNSSHALALAALRQNGYRSDNRYIVFQCIPHTLGLGVDVWQVLAHCHNLRNRGEYEGFLDVSEQLVTDLLLAADKLQEKVTTLID